MNMFPLNKNETGSFQELAHSSDVKFGQLSILNINPGCVRGGHYHTRKEEWFCCIHGKCEIKLNNVKDKSARTIILEEANREFVMVKPYENHIVTNPSDSEECELLIIISEEYNPADPDTVKYG
jgi:UDP-2-acetamido-2,6-beta-L-arabino-hexul-4-ose reductase